MKALAAGLDAHIQGGVTTLCWCWRLRRNDGIALGFTDHDRDLTFDGTTFEAAAGVTASEIRDSVGLGVDNLEVESALTSDHLREADILGGLYDDARVEIWRVNWNAAEQRVLVRVGSLGEIRRNGQSFTGEIRGLAHYLQQPGGRLYQYGCDADLGDGRCRIALTSPPLRATASVASIVNARTFSTNDIGSYAADWFTRGLLHFTSGANAGRSFEVKRHMITDGMPFVELWQEPLQTPQAGNTFTITAGCDKQVSTCHSKFSNIANFRGFPHMPGNDFVSAVASSGRIPTTSGN
jgi:uncharacterized phage protein (TIGR02218 family)